MDIDDVLEWIQIAEEVNCTWLHKPRLRLSPLLFLRLVVCMYNL